MRLKYAWCSSYQKNFDNCGWCWGGGGEGGWIQITNQITSDILAYRPSLLQRQQVIMQDGWVFESEPVFLTFMEPRNRFQGMNSASLCSLEGR
jgi:hypothetical protein